MGAGTPLILVADGDVLVRHALADYLRNCGYGVIEAATSDEAVKALGELSLDVDIVLSDAQLPGEMGGFGLRKWIRVHRPDIAVELAGSVAKAADAAAELCEQGPQMTRPYEPQAVVDRILQLRARSVRQSTATTSTSAPAIMAGSPTALPISARASGET